MRGFTLVELLVVIAIVAILSVVVILVLNPSELIKQAQDAQRINDVKQLDHGIQYALSAAALGGQTFDPDGPNFPNDSCKGQANPRIFVSVPSDNGETPPAPPAGWSWQQVPKADLKKADGSGWLPVNFQNYTGTGIDSVLKVLPADPVNTFASGLYYTYVCGSYEVDAAMASRKYKEKATVTDSNGNSLFEAGNDFALAPLRPAAGSPSSSSSSSSPPTVSFIAPASGTNDGSVSITTIGGQSFQSGAAVALTRTGQPDITGSGFLVATSTTISGGSFNINGAAAGMWNVVVLNPDAQSGVCTGCFTINNPSITPPAVSSANPSSSIQGTNGLSVALNGSNFQSGATASFSGTGITVNSVTFNSASQLTLNVDIAAGATAGARDVTVTNPDTGSGTGTGIFTVYAAIIPPTISFASPSSADQGTSASITLYGSNFQSGAVVSFSGTGITVSSTLVVSSTQLSVSISISGSAAATARDIAVTNPDGGSVVGSGVFDVTVPAAPAPSAASVSPSSQAQGTSNQTVTINGSNFVSGATVSFSGTGVSGGTVAFVGAGQLTVPVTVTAGAAVGARDVIVTNPDAQSGTCSGCFTVNAAPAITSVNPTSTAQNTTVTVTINGSNFQNGAALSYGGSGITQNAAPAFVNAGQLTSNITIAAGAATGTRNITVTNPDGGTGTGSAIFRITAAPTTLTATYTFDASLQSATATCTTVVCSRDTTDGSPGTGDLQEKLTAQNSNVTWQWEIPGLTWETLGVPAGSTVTGVDGSYNQRVVSSTNMNTAGANTSGVLTIRDSTGATALATLENAVSYTVATSTAWAANNALGTVAIPSGSQASATGIRIRLAGGIRTTNSSGSNVVLRQDQITLVITYIPQ